MKSGIVLKRLFSVFLILCMLLTQEHVMMFGAENTEVNEENSAKTASATSGTLGDNGGFKWTYDASSKTLTVTGEDTGLNADDFSSPFDDIGIEKKNIETIVFKKCIFKGSLANLLYGFFNAKTIEFDVCDTSKVTDMKNMFNGCSDVTKLDLSSFNTKNVTNMGQMFWNCLDLSEITLDNFNTSKVTNMRGMFSGCFEISSLDLSSFDTSKVTNMYGMFYCCENLKELNVSSFDTSNVLDMECMFTGCGSLEVLDLSNFNTAKVTSMLCMFEDCFELEDLDISNFDTASVTTMNGMFAGCRKLKSLNLSSFDTSNVTNMGCMFVDCAVDELDLSSFDTSNVTNMNGMFGSSMANCANLKSLNLSSFDMNKCALSEEEYFLKDYDELEILYTPKSIPNGIKLGLPTTFYDSNGNTLTEITSKHCNMLLTKTPYYTITYELNGGKNNSKNPTTYKKSSSTITLKNPTRKGYDFAGWYSDADFKTKVTKIEQGSTGNITLYAKWKAHKYNIKFNGNGADSGSMKTMSNRKYGTSYTLKANAFKKKGYTFTEWNTKKDGSGKNYANKASVKNLTSTDGKTLTLYAQWKKTKYTITYVLKDGGKNNSKNPTSYYITSSTKTLKNPTRKGYTFKGWYSDAKYKNKVTKIKKGSTGDKTFYAKWEAHKYNIAFEGNGATSGKMTILKAKSYGKSYKLTANKFKKKGYTFVGWNTKADGSGKYYKNKESVKNLTATNGKTVTLYAQWEKTKYKISYELYGGTNHSKNPDTYTSTTAKIKLKKPKREGYEFVAWHTSSKFTKKNIATTIEKGSTGNKKFYAEWKANKYTIVFDGNGADSGSMKKMSKCEYDKTYALTANAFVKTGCEFIGWNTKADGSGTAYGDGVSVMNLTTKKNGTVTLYAQWKLATQRAMWFMDDLYITQVPGGDYSHIGTQNFDVVGYKGNNNIYAPFDCVIKKIHTGETYGNTVIIESVEKVQYADGTYDYMSMAFAHDNNISDLYVGKEIKQGEVFYQAGDYGYVTGVHCHVTCIRGKYQNDMWTKTAYGTYSSPNGIHPTRALFVSKDTNVIDNKGLEFKIASN